MAIRRDRGSTARIRWWSSPRAAVHLANDELLRRLHGAPQEPGNIHLLLGVVVPATVIYSNAAPPSGAVRSSSAARIVDNAFRVLGLTPRASWPEVARTAEALLAALEAGDITVSAYDTPLGPRTRSAAAVRVARARLRDPDERIQQELWWEAPGRGIVDPRPEDAVDAAWPQAPAAWGWRPR